MISSAHLDTFARDNLPPREEWPDFLFSLPQRLHRVSKIYHYQWQGELAGPNSGWDSGLLTTSGAPRPGYNAVEKAIGRHR